MKMKLKKKSEKKKYIWEIHVHLDPYSSSSNKSLVKLPNINGCPRGWKPYFIKVLYSLNSSLILSLSLIYSSLILTYFFENRIWVSMNFEKDLNLTVNVWSELMGKQFLNCEANTLCVGEGSSMAVLKQWNSWVPQLLYQPCFLPQDEEYRLWARLSRFFIWFRFD